MSGPKPRPTPDEHRALAPVIDDLRWRLWAVIAAKLDRRTTAPVLDAANAAAHWLHVLAMRLQDDLDQPRVYQLGDDPSDRPGPPRPPGKPRRLSADEHVELGAELYALRDDVVAVFMWLAGRYPKRSRVLRAARNVEQLVDRLRCRLDDLFCYHHPEAFTTKAYYPGGGTPPAPVGVATVGAGEGGQCR